MTRLYFIRHAETEWNRDGNRYCGRTDLPLTNAGKLQAANLAALLQSIPFDRALVSPMIRAQETAEPIIRRAGMRVQSDERLREIDFGDWEGLTPQEVQHHFPQQWEKWLQDPSTAKAGGCGETAQNVFDRMASLLMEVHSDEGQHILVVSHNTAIRLFAAGTLGMPLAQYRRIEIDNAGLMQLEMASLTDVRWKAGSPLGNDKPDDGIQAAEGTRADPWR